MSAAIPPGLWRALDDARTALDEGEAGAGAVAISRRDFLKLGAAAAALASAGCQGPVEEIVPSARARDVPPGVPRFFATSLERGGYATGVLVETHEGRPTKVEGNAAHPASLGAAGIFEQAAVLDFWDPARSRSVLQAREPASREALEGALQARLAALEPKGGEGLRILVRPSASPTRAGQLAALLRRYPAARVHAWEPLHRDQAFEGARLAYGRAAEVVPRLEAADVVVSFGRDVLGDAPGMLRHAREFAARRRAGDGKPMSRVYVLESTPSLTGAAADHRVACTPQALAASLATLAQALRDGSTPANAVLAAAARDLLANRGKGLVLVGESLPPAAHALALHLDELLGNAGRTSGAIEPVRGDADCVRDITALASDMAAGKVDTLVILAGNPAYDAPADLGFGGLLARVPFTLHLAAREDETSALCRWHVPRTQDFEHWSDGRAFDGTASVTQPLARPLHGAISEHELLGLLASGTLGNGRDAVRAQWKAGDDAAWRSLLREGVAPDSAFAPLALRTREVAFAPPPEAANGWSVVFTPDESTHDGEWAHNAWLQELPRPHSKLVWDNAAYIAPDDAAQLGIGNGDGLELSVGDRRLVIPAWILPGQAAHTVAISLGQGRTRGGEVGAKVGADAYPLRLAGSQWVAAVQARKGGGHRTLATTQNHARMEGRDPVQRVSAADAATRRAVGPKAAKAQPTLYPPWTYDSYRWGMVVDLTSCIGCNACTIACQAENNIPTVGREEVARGREMHWIRVDRYYEGSQAAPRTHFQPVPCMHCEKAPCEPVCPVGATMHDSEGINVQVYNRCVGTRFCSNNCPYKVRRFNFLHYTGRASEPPLEARNPDVTVRMRGVMEKCNYCLQRITRARIASEREGRRIAEGEVVTACQAACPTRAITFGDLADPASAASRARADPLDYALLEELATLPRTTYLARVSNPGEAKDA